jgi:hypothetical protein
MAAVIAVSGVAYAFWTATGSGAGTVQAGTPSTLTVNQTSTITGLYPGGPAQALSGNFDNPNAYSVYVTSVTASVSSISGNPGTCATTNFVVAGTSNVPGLVPAGTGKGAWSGLTVQLVETGSNQDGCKGATVHLAYLAS